MDLADRPQNSKTYAYRNDGKKLYNKTKEKLVSSIISPSLKYEELNSRLGNLSFQTLESASRSKPAENFFGRVLKGKYFTVCISRQKAVFRIHYNPVTSSGDRDIALLTNAG